MRRELGELERDPVPGGREVRDLRAGAVHRGGLLTLLRESDTRLVTVVAPAGWARPACSEARARELARILQQSLLPPALPEIRGLDIAALYRPSGDGAEVGGDFYDVFQTGRDDWAFVVGDVRGKGPAAAAVAPIPP